MAKAVVFDEVGGPEVLRIVEVEVGEPGPGEVLVRISVIGLNRAEALFRAGDYYYQPQLPASRLGFEAAGEVVAVGPEVTGFAPGDRVVSTVSGHMSSTGVYGDLVLMPATALDVIPDGMSDEAAAASWLSYGTAYGALVEQGQLRPGDHVVITAASSSVGVAAIQVANHFGAVPIAVTRTAAKRDELIELGAAHVIVSDEEPVAERVRELTGGAGAELVFDAVAGAGLPDLATAAAAGGLLIVYGWLDRRPALLPLNWPLRVLGYAYGTLARDPAFRRRQRHFLAAGMRAGTLVPVIDRTFELAEVVDAHRHLESNDQIGKVLVRVGG
ncbi:zinc-dependent alcohol dehydrogenase family protein [Kitasatospora viridis]|uniref:NADPH:quinone reductase-like Zn-dependent oxidoreductase n=1 Tax=Kitasatospora viridis TaxID=281105 RepID=A0A561UJT0_9ACTN|nr:zinc-dependent alcohol dehydrogenase family protein [Kitasatospora viridis]TWF99618.1 NADPH:quinone reductase-like Zn-dependent oxidoreductase [Kitasatospora viridis]